MYHVYIYIHVNLTNNIYRIKISSLNTNSDNIPSQLPTPTSTHQQYHHHSICAFRFTRFRSCLTLCYVSAYMCVCVSRWGLNLLKFYFHHFSLVMVSLPSGNTECFEYSKSLSFCLFYLINVCRVTHCVMMIGE